MKRQGTSKKRRRCRCRRRVVLRRPNRSICQPRLLCSGGVVLSTEFQVTKPVHVHTSQTVFVNAICHLFSSMTLLFSPFLGLTLMSGFATPSRLRLIFQRHLSVFSSKQPWRPFNAPLPSRLRTKLQLLSIESQFHYVSWCSRCFMLRAAICVWIEARTARPGRHGRKSRRPAKEG